MAPQLVANIRRVEAWLGKHLHEEFRTDYSDAKWVMASTGLEILLADVILQMVESPGAVGLVLKKAQVRLRQLRRQPAATRLAVRDPHQ